MIPVVLVPSRIRTSTLAGSERAAVAVGLCRRIPPIASPSEPAGIGHPLHRAKGCVGVSLIFAAAKTSARCAGALPNKWARSVALAMCGLGSTRRFFRTSL